MCCWHILYHLFDTLESSMYITTLFGVNGVNDELGVSQQFNGKFSGKRMHRGL